jgi:hypothetical protein
MNESVLIKPSSRWLADMECLSCAFATGKLRAAIVQVAAGPGWGFLASGVLFVNVMLRGVLRAVARVCESVPRVGNGLQRAPKLTGWKAGPTKVLKWFWILNGEKCRRIVWKKTCKRGSRLGANA